MIRRVLSRVAFVLALALVTASCGAARYAPDKAGGTTLDRELGLEWQRDYNVAGLTFDQAKAYCAGLRIGDHADWRLPVGGADDVHSTASGEWFKFGLKATSAPTGNGVYSTRVVEYWDEGAFATLQGVSISAGTGLSSECALAKDPAPVVASPVYWTARLDGSPAVTIFGGDPPETFTLATIAACAPRGGAPYATEAQLLQRRLWVRCVRSQEVNHFGVY